VRDEFQRPVFPSQGTEQLKTTRMTTTKEAAALREPAPTLL
jgi:hypothetical protein